MEFIGSKKGTRKLISNGHMYLFQTELPDEVTSWECELRRGGQCKARIKLYRNNAFLQEVNDHTHSPTQTKVEVVNVKASIKRRVGTSLDALQQIITSELKGISEAVLL